jgi:hypothetical protein
MVQSYMKLTSVDRGYSAEGVLTATLACRTAKRCSIGSSMTTVAERMRRIPGAQSMAA